MENPRVFEFLIFDPRKDSQSLELLLAVRKNENQIINDLVMTHEGRETDDGDFVYDEIDLGPEDDVIEKIIKDDNSTPDLHIAYEEALSINCQFSFRVHPDLLNFLQDSIEIDDEFLRPGIFRNIGVYEIRSIMLFYGEDRPGRKQYYGDVWYFTHSSYPRYCGIYGMKSSITNILLKISCGKDIAAHRNNIARRIIEDGVMALQADEKEVGKRKIIVPWPLPPMIPTLLKMGFQEVNTNENTPERMFLSGITGTSNYFIL